MSALEELRDQLAGVADDVYPDQLAATVEQLDTVAANLAEALRGSVNTHAHTALAQSASGNLMWVGVLVLGSR